jgi:crossover junction endodeoxyribonuclease RusA
VSAVGEQQHDAEGRRIWTLPLAFTKPLNLNDRPSISVGAMHARRKEVKAWRMHAADLAKAAGIPRLERFGAQLHYQPRDNRKRDTHNLARAMKPLVDGLVDGHVCVDDDTEHYRGFEPVIHPARKGEPGRIWLVVVDLSDEPGTQSALPIEGVQQ